MSSIINDFRKAVGYKGEKNHCIFIDEKYSNKNLTREVYKRNKIFKISATYAQDNGDLIRKKYKC